jgi:cellobiose phosphorylase
MTEPSSTPPKAGSRAGAALVDELLRPFQQEAKATRLAIENRSAAQRRINTWLIAFVAVTALLVVLVLVILMQNRQKSAEARQLIRTNADLSAQIADCTKVGGTCYEQSQARLRKTIGVLIEGNKAIAQCARSTTTDAALDACVAAKVKLVVPPASPSPAPSPSN